MRYSDAFPPNFTPDSNRAVTVTANRELRMGVDDVDVRDIGIDLCRADAGAVVRLEAAGRALLICARDYIYYFIPVDKFPYADRGVTSAASGDHLFPALE